MYKLRKTTFHIAPKGTSRVYQTFEDAGFVYNRFGHVMNEFSRLMATNDNIALAQRLNMAVASPSEELPFGRTDREKIDLLRSRYVQTPAELDRYELSVLDAAEAYFKSLEDKGNASPSVSVSPDVSPNTTNNVSE